MSLGVIQSGFGVLVEGAGVGDRVLPEGHAAAGQGAAAVHPLLHLGKDAGDVRPLDTGQQDGEAVAVDPVEPPGAVGHILQSLNNTLEDGVADPAALLEIDGLQVVHAQHQKKAVGRSGQGGADLLLQALHAEGAGKVVGLAVGLTGGDPSGHPAEAAGLVLTTDAPADHPDHGAVFLHQAVLQLMDGDLLLTHHAQELLDLGQVPGVDNPGEILQGADASRILGEGIQLAAPAGETDLIGHQIQQEEEIVVARLQKSPQGLEKGQFILLVHCHEPFLLSSVLQGRPAGTGPICILIVQYTRFHKKVKGFSC